MKPDFSGAWRHRLPVRRRVQSSRAVADELGSGRTPKRRAAEFWRHSREDFQTCRSMVLSAFRLSIEWSRLQPTHRNKPDEPPPFDDEALNRRLPLDLPANK